MAIRVKTVNYCLGNMSGVSYGIDKSWKFDGTSTWENETTDINSSTASDVGLSNNVNSAIYFGSSSPFLSIGFDTGTAPSGGSWVWEYYNGSWVTITSNGTQTLADNTTNHWNLPSDWTTTRVNSEVDGPWYYVRVRVATLKTTAGSLSTVTVGNRLTISNATTIEIPETNSRTIRTVLLRLYEQTSDTSSQDFKAVIGRYNSNSFGDLITKYTTANAWTRGESAGYYFDIDITSLSNTTLSAGTSHTFDCYSFMSGRGNNGNVYIRNGWGELLITYSFDDVANTTQLNTIILPFDSNTGALTASLTNLGGTSACPALLGTNGIIKENGVQIKNCYLTFLSNAVEGGTTDFSFASAIDTGGETTLATFDAANDSDFFAMIPWNLSAGTSFNLSASHDIKARVTTVTGATMDNCGALLTVTYSFNNDTTTYYTHTDIIPWDMQAVKIGGTTAADTDYNEKIFWVEGTSATLLRGGVLNYFYQNADPGNLILKYGNQTARTYNTPSTTVSGPTPIIQRYDSGAVAGSGLTFQRGKNTLACTYRVDTTRTAAGSITSILYNTFYYLKGSNRHSTAMYIAVPQPNFTNSEIITGSLYTYIPESNYYIHCYGLEVHDTTADAYSTKNLRVKKNNNEGWVISNPVDTGLDAIDGTRITFSQFGERVKRYPQQPYVTSSDDIVDLVNFTKTTSLDGVNAKSSAIVWVNWYDFTWNTTLTIQNSSGGTVNVCIRDMLDNKPILATSRVGNGTIDLTYYDNTRDVIAASLEGITKSAQSIPFRIGD